MPEAVLRRIERQQTMSLRQMLAELPKGCDVRYNQRSSAERTNSQLKDNYGGNHVRVRGHAKVFAHLCFGVLCITATQIMRFVT